MTLDQAWDLSQKWYGNRLAPEVAEAMAEAARSHVQIDELQARASVFLAEATGAQAGLVTSGAAAGLRSR